MYTHIGRVSIVGIINVTRDIRDVFILIQMHWKRYSARYMTYLLMQMHWKRYSARYMMYFIMKKHWKQFMPLVIKIVSYHREKIYINIENSFYRRLNMIHQLRI